MLRGDEEYSAYELRIYPLPEGRELLVGVFKDQRRGRPDRAFRITIPPGFKDWGRLNRRTCKALQSGNGPVYIDLG